MRDLNLFRLGSVALLIASIDSPAFAGALITPAPVLGAGVGALALLGLGYYSFRKRMRR